MPYSRIRQGQVSVKSNGANGGNGKKRVTRHYPFIMYQGRELGLGPCRTKAEAENVINIAWSNIAAGRAPRDTGPTNVTMDELWEQMLETGSSTRSWRLSTISLYEGMYRLHIRPEFGRKDLAEITNKDVQSWVNKLCAKKGRLGKPLSASTVNIAFRNLRHMLNQAVDFGFIEKSPIVRIHRPPLNDDEIYCLNVEEIESVLEDLDLRERTFFAILGYAGLRCGEALALKREDIDFEKASIRITRSWSPKNGFDKPKTKAGRRSVPIVAAVGELLQRYCREQRFEPEDLLFPSIRKQKEVPVSSPFRKQLNAALEFLELPHATVHSFRHSYASMMVASGASIIALSKAMGHEDAFLTLNRYSHLYPQDIENALARVNQLIQTKRLTND
jgi:integrase